MKAFRSQPIAARLTPAVLAILTWAACASAQQPGAAQPAKAADSRQLVAVLEFEAPGATKLQASTVTDQVREGLLASGAYRLVDRAQMDKVLEEQALQQQGCTTQECAVQVGKILGVRKLVTGKLTRVEDTLWVLTATLVDVETAETLRAVSVQQEGAFRTVLIAGSAALVAKLTEQRASAVAQLPAPSTAPAPPPAPISRSTEGQNGTAAAQPAEPARPRDPRQGFTFYGGLRSESGTFKFKPAGSAEPKLQVAALSGSTLVLPTSGTAKLAATGLGLGGDYQWVLAPLWTVTAYLEGSSGQVSGDLADVYQSVGSSSIGTEVRYWLAEDKYVGGALMVHNETLTPTDDAKTKYKLEPVSASSGVAVAVVGGWEVRPRFTLSASLESGSATFANADYSYSALRLTAAYRWPFPAGKP